MYWCRVYLNFIIKVYLKTPLINLASIGCGKSAIIKIIEVKNMKNNCFCECFIFKNFKTENFRCLILLIKW